MTDWDWEGRAAAREGVALLPKGYAGTTCASCRFALFRDYGYSSYTVEGTEFYCTIKAHPADGFDSFYERDPRLVFAAECAQHDKGDSIDMDVDGEKYDSLTDEQKALYDGWLDE